MRMGAMDGIETCRELKALLPSAAVLMLTSFGTEEVVLAALMAGASGFLLKNTGRAEGTLAPCAPWRQGSRCSTRR